MFDTRGRLIQPKQRRVFAKFRRGVAPGWAQKIGVATFEMRDRPVEVTPEAWLCAYDSDADEWNDEEKKEVVHRLDELGYLKVEKPRLPAPYPMYDRHRKTAGRRTIDMALADIRQAFETAGFDVETAVAYEQENGNDPQVLALLRELGGLDEEPAAEPADDVIAA